MDKSRGRARVDADHRDHVAPTWSGGPPTTEPVPLSHPDVLWHAGLVAGRHAAHPERARIVELGCGDGANLTPMAEALPGADLVGVEPDTDLRTRAEAAVAALGLANLTLRCEDPPTDAEDGPGFDYVLVPDLAFRPSARAEPLLTRIRALLAPDGVAFFAYPTPPGGALRHSLAEVLHSQATGGELGTAVIEARRALAAMAAHLPADPHPYAELVRLEIARAARLGDRALVYEYLRPRPALYDRQELERLAAEAELEVVADLGPTTTDPRLGSALRTGLARHGAPALVDVLADLVQGREAHWVALARATTGSTDRPALLEQLAAGRLVAPLLCTDPDPWLGPRSPLDFLTLGGEPYRVEEPLPKAVLLALSLAWPSGLTFDELVQEVLDRLSATPGVPPLEDAPRHIAVFLLEPLRHRFVRLTPRCLRAHSARPDAPRLSEARRRESEQHARVTGPYHDVLRLDEIDRLLVARLDGRLLAELGRELCELARDGELAFVDEGVSWPTDELLHFLDQRLPLLLTRLHHIGALG